MKAFVKFIGTFFILFVLWGNEALAQGCAMCTATASNLDEKAAKGLNWGIIYLGIIPFIMFGVLFYRWHKANKHNSDS